MFNYQIDIENIILQRLRLVKRTPIAKSLLFSFAAGLNYVYQCFVNNREKSIKHAKIIGTKVYLEKYINDIFGVSGITIQNLDPEGYIYFASSTSDGNPAILLNDVVGSLDAEPGDQEYYDNLADFEVRIPSAIYSSIDHARLRASLNQYILSTINYNIISI